MHGMHDIVVLLKENFNFRSRQQRSLIVINFKHDSCFCLYREKYRDDFEQTRFLCFFVYLFIAEIEFISPENRICARKHRKP